MIRLLAVQFSPMFQKIAWPESRRSVHNWSASDRNHNGGTLAAHFKANFLYSLRRTFQDAPPDGVEPVKGIASTSMCRASASPPLAPCR